MSKTGVVGDNNLMCKANPYPWDGPEGSVADAASQPESAKAGDKKDRSRAKNNVARDQYKEPKKHTSVTSRLTRLGRCTTKRASLVPLERGEEKPLGFYAESVSCDGGQKSVEVGGVRQQWKDGARLDVLTLKGSVRPRGIESHATMFAGTTSRGSVVGVEGEVFRAGGVVKCDEEGLSVGAQATIVGGSLRLGSTDRKSDQDEQLRAGLSGGAGSAARVHWGDEDGDGRPEYGVGVDIGPISVDFKSETPLKSLAKLLTIGPLPNKLSSPDE